jgi:hypothetical protein
VLPSEGGDVLLWHDSATYVPHFFVGTRLREGGVAEVVVRTTNEVSSGPGSTRSPDVAPK